MKLMYRLILISLFLLAGRTWAADSALMQVRFTNLTKEARLDLLQSGMDLVPPLYPDQPEVIVSQEEYRQLLARGFQLEIARNDVVGFYQSRMTRDRNYGDFHTYSEGMAEIQQLHSDFPDLVSDPIVIGQSLQGNNVWAVKISDNPEVDEDEPEVFYNSYIHAREAITVEVLLYFMHHLTDNYGSDPRVTDIVNERELWFVPFMNPDGVLYNEQTNPNGGGMWRKTRRNNGDGSWGVDPNRNWGYEWGFDNSGSSPYGSDETYRGPYAFSEPSQQSVREFINSRHFANSITYHSYSDLIIYPWGYDEIYTEDHAVFTQVAQQMAQYNGYTPGTAWELLYPVNGDTDDWMYGATDEHPKMLAYTVEVGDYYDGFWPDESDIPTLCEENLEPNLYFAEIADGLWTVGPPATPVLTELGSVDADYQLTWNTPDPDPQNPAVAYQVWEMYGQSIGNDDFESGSGNWTEEGASFLLSSQQAASGTWSYWAGGANQTSFISTLAEPFTVSPGNQITFNAWFDIENDWDYAYVEVSNNGGSTWTTIPGNITTTSNSHGNNDGYGITGNSGGWVNAVFDLATYTGQDIQVRLRYTTDYSVLYEGIYVDDFSPVIGFATETMLTDDCTEEYFDITGQAAGTYYYKVRAVDAQDDLSVFSNTIEVECSGISTEPEPVDLSIAVDGTYVVLTWEAAPNATSYDIYGSGLPWSGFTFIANRVNTTYTETLGGSTMKYYMVVSRND